MARKRLNRLPPSWISSGIRVRVHQRGMNDAEDRCGRADAQRTCKHGCSPLIFFSSLATVVLYGLTGLFGRGYVACGFSTHSWLADFPHSSTRTTNWRPTANFVL